MIVGLVGPKYSGKGTLARYLEERHEFKRVDLNELPAELAFEENGPETLDSEESKEPAASHNVTGMV